MVMDVMEGIMGGVGVGISVYLLTYPLFVMLLKCDPALDCHMNRSCCIFHPPCIGCWLCCPIIGACCIHPPNCCCYSDSCPCCCCYMSNCCCCGICCTNPPNCCVCLGTKGRGVKLTCPDALGWMVRSWFFGFPPIVLNRVAFS